MIAIIRSFLGYLKTLFKRCSSASGKVIYKTNELVIIAKNEFPESSIEYGFDTVTITISDNFDYIHKIVFSYDKSSIKCQMINGWCYFDAIFTKPGVLRFIVNEFNNRIDSHWERTRNLSSRGNYVANNRLVDSIYEEYVVNHNMVEVILWHAIGVIH